MKTIFVTLVVALTTLFSTPQSQNTAIAPESSDPLATHRTRHLLSTPANDTLVGSRASNKLYRLGDTLDPFNLTLSSSVDFDIVPTGYGKFWVAASLPPTDNPTSNIRNLYVAPYDKDLQQEGDIFNLTSNSTGNQITPRGVRVSATDRRFVYEGTQEGSSQVYEVRYQGDTLLSDERVTPISELNGYTVPYLVTTSDGSSIIVMARGGDSATLSPILGIKYGANGQLQRPLMFLSDPGQDYNLYPRGIQRPHGPFVTWTRSLATSGSETQAMGKFFNNHLYASQQAFPLADDPVTMGRQEYAHSGEAFSDGAAVVTVSSQNLTTNHWRAWAKIYRANGEVERAAFDLADNTTKDNAFPRVTILNDLIMVFAWWQEGMMKGKAFYRNGSVAMDEFPVDNETVFSTQEPLIKNLHYGNRFVVGLQSDQLALYVFNLSSPDFIHPTPAPTKKGLKTWEDFNRTEKILTITLPSVAVLLGIIITPIACYLRKKQQNMATQLDNLA